MRKRHRTTSMAPTTAPPNVMAQSTGLTTLGHARTTHQKATHGIPIDGGTAALSTS